MSIAEPPASPTNMNVTDHANRTSPCVGLCEIDEATGACRGCARTLTEIARWRHFTDEEREDVLSDLARRQRAETDPSA